MTDYSDDLPPCASNPRLFTSVDPDAHAEAKAICATCPVIDWCKGELKKARDAAGKDHTLRPEGTWAGRLIGRCSPETGRVVKDRPPCGTPRGYRYHLRHDEDVCDPCRTAQREKSRKEAARRRAKVRAA